MSRGWPAIPAPATRTSVAAIVGVMSIPILSPAWTGKAGREGVHPSSRGEALAGPSSGPEDPANDSDRHGRGVAARSDLDPPPGQHPGRRDRQAPRTSDVGRVGATRSRWCRPTPQAAVVGRAGWNVVPTVAAACARGAAISASAIARATAAIVGRDVGTARADEGRAHLRASLAAVWSAPGTGEARRRRRA